ncbi:AAA family ATPase [Chitinophaga agri]|uniref:AAA domain-containing protein n=1 Tax=Chitinophaga agri TaxID=2703787 RepID=A0A6B9ZEP5_9BACT|nr:AAA family ATPase [Chitinophaga agri]QHS59794.1 AAA domain-containing protein [Chitinophaga agri]
MQPVTFESPLVDKLNGILQRLKGTFVGKDDVIDLMGICLAGRENLFLFGPPGTAKSAIVRELSRQLDVQTFEYLLTRFTEPNELFGPFDIRKLRDGELVTNTEGMLPEASLVFLDELLNANSAILNSLLMALNEKIFRRGKETRELPALIFIGASNHLPEDEALQALFDRFLLRVRCTNVDPAMLNSVLQAGWGLEQAATNGQEGIPAADLRTLQQLTTTVDLNAVRPDYIMLIQQLRNAGVQISDRRAVKLQRLIAASALLCKRTTAILSDLWVLRYIWDTEEQVEIIAGIVNTVIAQAATHPQEHPRANNSGTPDAETLYSEVEELHQQWDDPAATPASRAQIKDRLRSITSRCEWISNATQRNYVQEPIDGLWKKIMQTA